MRTILLSKDMQATKSLCNYCRVYLRNYLNKLSHEKKFFEVFLCEKCSKNKCIQESVF